MPTFLTSCNLWHLVWKFIVLRQADEALPASARTPSDEASHDKGYIVLFKAMMVGDGRWFLSNNFPNCLLTTKAAGKLKHVTQLCRRGPASCQ